MTHNTLILNNSVFRLTCLVITSTDQELKKIYLVTATKKTEEKRNSENIQKNGSCRISQFILFTNMCLAIITLLIIKV